MWEDNKSQAGSLESIIMDGAKQILGYSSKTCNEAVSQFYKHKPNMVRG